MSGKDFTTFIQPFVFVVIVLALTYLGMMILDCTTGSTLAGGC